MVSPPLVTYITSAAQSAENIVNHYVLSSIKLSPKKLKDFVFELPSGSSKFDNIFATVLLREYTMFSKPALRILQELSASLLNMKNLLMFVRD